MHPSRHKTAALFVALYLIVSLLGTAATLLFPVYGDGDAIRPNVPGEALRLAPKETAGNEAGQIRLQSVDKEAPIALVSTSGSFPEVTAGGAHLVVSFQDAITGTLQVAEVPSELLDSSGAVELVAPAGLGSLTACSVERAQHIVASYTYCLPLVQGMYLMLALYGLLLYGSKHEQSLLMFSLYALALFAWGVASYLSRGSWQDWPIAGVAVSITFGLAVAYGIATCVCFCKLEVHGKPLSLRWYFPLVAGVLFGVGSVGLPRLLDSALVIAIYMVGGVALICTFDARRQAPKAVLYGLSISQALRTVFLLSSLMGVPVPLPFELMRQMHLLAAPYVVGCLVDVGGAFSRRFKQAECQALELERANRELERANRTLDERVEARTRELARQQELRASVLANLFHDCKTPLSVIRGSLACLRDEGSFDLKQIEIAERQALHLTEIIDELFAAVKLEDGALLMDTEPVPLAALLEEVVSSCSVEAQGRGIAISFSGASKAVAWGDEVWLGRAFQNLVGNAVNFSKPGGIVEVTLADDGGRATVAVTDHGMGIAPEEIDKVFERYYRTAKERTSRRSSGLGLSIAQGVIQRHDGTIGVSSELGKGTTFTVTLPIWGHDE